MRKIPVKVQRNRSRKLRLEQAEKGTMGDENNACSCPFRHKNVPVRSEEGIPGSGKQEMENGRKVKYKEISKCMAKIQYKYKEVQKVGNLWIFQTDRRKLSTAQRRRNAQVHQKDISPLPIISSYILCSQIRPGTAKFYNERIGLTGVWILWRKTKVRCRMKQKEIGEKIWAVTGDRLTCRAWYKQRRSRIIWMVAATLGRQAAYIPVETNVYQIIFFCKTRRMAAFSSLHTYTWFSQGAGKRGKDLSAAGRDPRPQYHQEMQTFIPCRYILKMIMNRQKSCQIANRKSTNFHNNKDRSCIT